MTRSVFDKVDKAGLDEVKDEVSAIDDELRIIMEDLQDTVSGKMEITSVALAQILLEKLNKLSERLY